MEIITIESSAYKELLAKIDRIEHHILSVNVGADGNKVNVWLSSKEAMWTSKLFLQIKFGSPQ